MKVMCRHLAAAVKEDGIIFAGVLADAKCADCERERCEHLPAGTPGWITCLRCEPRATAAGSWDANGSPVEGP